MKNNNSSNIKIAWQHTNWYNAKGSEIFPCLACARLRLKTLQATEYSTNPDKLEILLIEKDNLVRNDRYIIGYFYK